MWLLTYTKQEFFTDDRRDGALLNPRGGEDGGQRSPCLHGEGPFPCAVRLLLDVHPAVRSPRRLGRLRHRPLHIRAYLLPLRKAGGEAARMGQDHGSTMRIRVNYRGASLPADECLCGSRPIRRQFQLKEVINMESM